MTTSFIKYFDKATLVKAAKLAKRRNYNRQLSVKKLQDKLPDLSFPVSFSMLHEHAGGERVAPHVRVMIVVSELGDTVWLDVDMSIYNSLPEWEVDMDAIREEAKAKAS